MTEQSVHPEISRYIPFVELVAKTLGAHCEVVLHDFNNLPKSIVAICNGHVTGRNVDSPVTGRSLEIIKKGHNASLVLNYAGKSFDGKELKSSTYFIQDDRDTVIGCYCINIDITPLSAAQKLLAEMVNYQDAALDKKKAKSRNTVSSVLDELVNDAIESAGKPVAYMSKEEKVAIVNVLNGQGAFLVKGAIDNVAKVLSVSRYTIYNYLDEVKETNGKETI